MQDRVPVAPSANSSASVVLQDSDVLSAIFSLLPIGGLHRVQALGAMRTMPSLGITVRHQKWSPVEDVIRSSLIAHCTTYGIERNGSHQFIPGARNHKVNPSSQLDSQRLLTAIEHMPHLTEMHIDLSVRVGCVFVRRIAYLAQLRTLHLQLQGFPDFDGDSIEPAAVNCIIKAIGRLQRLEELKLVCEICPDPRISFAPLGAALHLRRLTLQRVRPGALSLSPVQLALIQLLPLTHLQIGPESA